MKDNFFFSGTIFFYHLSMFGLVLLFLFNFWLVVNLLSVIQSQFTEENLIVHSLQVGGMFF